MFFRPQGALAENRKFFHEKDFLLQIKFLICIAQDIVEPIPGGSHTKAACCNWNFRLILSKIHTVAMSIYALIVTLSFY